MSSTFNRLTCSALLLAAMAGSVMGSAAQEGRAEPLGWQAIEHRAEERGVEGRRVQEHHATLVLSEGAASVVPFDNLFVGIVSSPMIRTLAIDGILGADFLDAFRLTIDRRARELRLDVAR